METMMSEEIRKTCVTVSRCRPEEVRNNHLVVGWTREIQDSRDKSAYIRATGGKFSIRTSPAEGYKKVKDPYAELGKWAAKQSTQRCCNSLRFNEELEVKALSDEEYQEELDLEEEVKKQRAIQEKYADKKIDKRTKRSRFNWSELKRWLADGETLEQIAEKLGCSTAAVRRQAKIQKIDLPKRKRGRKKSKESK